MHVYVYACVHVCVCVCALVRGVYYALVYACLGRDKVERVRVEGIRDRMILRPTVSRWHFHALLPRPSHLIDGMYGQKTTDGLSLGLTLAQPLVVGQRDCGKRIQAPSGSRPPAFRKHGPSGDGDRPAVAEVAGQRRRWLHSTELQHVQASSTRDKR